mmetsp:Transcript_14936/g.48028  ORF Transcript_14936/g.48028 Transcript_14936/m.48028 type:complete len:438 (-) Transcript_14936:367-1680(-)
MDMSWACRGRVHHSLGPGARAAAGRETAAKAAARTGWAARAARDKGKAPVRGLRQPCEQAVEALRVRGPLREVGERVVKGGDRRVCEVAPPRTDEPLDLAHAPRGAVRQHRVVRAPLLAPPHLWCGRLPHRTRVGRRRRRGVRAGLDVGVGVGRRGPLALLMMPRDRRVGHAAGSQRSGAVAPVERRGGAGGGGCRRLCLQPRLAVGRSPAVTPPPGRLLLAARGARGGGAAGLRLRRVDEHALRERAAPRPPRAAVRGHPVPPCPLELEAGLRLAVLLLQPLGVHLARVLATPVAQREYLVAAREAAHVHQPNALPTRKARHAQIAPWRSARRAPCGARRAVGAGAAAAARGGGSVTARQAPRRLLAGEDDCARRAQRLLSALPPPLLAFPAPPPRVRLGVAGRALRLGAALLWRRRNRPRDGLVPAHCELHRRRR